MECHQNVACKQNNVCPNSVLAQISKLTFAVIEAALFLDTHPGDKDALSYYKEALGHLTTLKKQYIESGHSLSITDTGSFDDYSNGPWPWEVKRNVGI